MIPHEIQALVVVLFPEFTQVFADPCLPAALQVLKAHPSAQDIVAAGVEAIGQVLRNPEHPPTRSGRPSAQKVVELARKTARSGRAVTGRAVSLRILCDQLEHTQANLARLETEIEQLLTNDPQVKGLQQIPEFGTKTAAVLRAELGDAQRFAHTDEVIAYSGMDIEIKESGQWKGRAKLSKRGSGLLRRMLYLAALRSLRLEASPFGAYYRRLVERGLKKGSALMAVMRKMLAVAAHLLLHEEEAYNPSKVCAGATGR